MVAVDRLVGKYDSLSWENAKEEFTTQNIPKVRLFILRKRQGGVYHTEYSQILMRNYEHVM
jgi:hypothetical protein